MLWPVLSDASVLRDCVNLEVSVPRGVPVRWETSSLGLETLFFRGKKSRRHVQKYATLLLITEEISYLDWWKYANSTLIATSHYVPFNVRQSGTFAPSETGKVIPQEKKKGASCSGFGLCCGETTVWDEKACVCRHPWATASGVHLSAETTVQTGKVCRKKAQESSTTTSVWSVWKSRWMKGQRY